MPPELENDARQIVPEFVDASPFNFAKNAEMSLSADADNCKSPTLE